MPSPVWRERWTRLKDAGLTVEQAKVVYALIEEVNGHHTQTLATLSWDELENVFIGRSYEVKLTETDLNVVLDALDLATGSGWEQEDKERAAELHDRLHL